MSSVKPRVTVHPAHESIPAPNGALMNVANVIFQCIKYPSPVAMSLKKYLGSFGIW